MNTINHLRNRIRGWLPEQPKESSILKSKPNGINSTNKSMYRIGGLFLPALGISLIAIYAVNIFEFNYTHFDIANLRWLLYFAYLAGIVAVLAGIRIRLRTKSIGASEFKKSYLVAGIIVISVSAIGSVISNESLLSFDLTHTASEVARISWWNQPSIYLATLWILPIIGLLILLTGRAKQTKMQLSTKTSLCILSIGGLSLIITAIILLLLQSALITLNTLTFSIISYDSLYGVPFGVLCLNIAWLFLLSTQSQFQVNGSMESER